MESPHGRPSASSLPAPTNGVTELDFSRSDEDQIAGMSKQTDRMSLVPPRRLGDDRRRESTQDSVEQAEGIFDLYERDRDSWVDQRASTHASHLTAPAGQENGQYTTGENSAEFQEVLGEPPTSPASQRSWDGPFSALAQPSPDSTVQAPPTPARGLEGDSRRSSGLRMGNGNGIDNVPPIIVTPDKTLQARFARRDRDSTMSTSTSTSASLALSLTPSPAHGRRIFGRNNSATGSANTSQISVAASSQYPGEENDAFHVRSTCESSLLLLETLRA